MATKVRLQRHGKKGNPFYFIVAIDEKAKRDGKYIEKLGTYNPSTNPPTVDLNFERALYWIQVGAQATDTASGILSKEGVLMKDHLLRGVKKGAFDAAEAEKRFSKWSESKLSANEKEIAKLAKAKADANKKKAQAEVDANLAKAAAIVAKNTPVEEVAAEEPVAEPAVEAEANTEAEA